MDERNGPSATMRRFKPDLDRLSVIIAGPEEREAKIRAWLKELCGATHHFDSQIAWLRREGEQHHLEGNSVAALEDMDKAKRLEKLRVTAYFEEKLLFQDLSSITADLVKHRASREVILGRFNDYKHPIWPRKAKL